MPEANTSNQAFNQAANERARKLTGLQNKDLLQLYGLFKVATGEDFSKESQPGFMSGISARPKYDAWKAVVDRGLSPEEAQAEYIALVEKFEKEQSGK
ncbi:hypothetical protein EsDP_00001471 [Epichloe bromicola]|uniref:ACB domain-containing protein n=1 Tax=Epichloe bromicola TaxID=79588 RepID=A0ABQ0CHY6_9HYPO